MNTNLKSKNALVCGSSKGIGKAAAIEIALLGANVTLVARNEATLREVCKQLDTSMGQEHHILPMDFSESEMVTQKIEELVAERNIHILVNNTGGPPGGLIQHANPESFLQAFNNHLICNHIITTNVIKGMKADGYGRIINVISTSVKQPLPGLGVSNTIRGAVANWSKTMANEVGAFGITVNNVLPGATDTERLEEIIKNKAGKTDKTESEVIKEMEGSIPLKRFGRPEEIGAAIAFLSSPAAAYISGINLPVDGGRTKCL